MLIILKSVARTLILPPAGLLLIAFIGLLLWPRRRRLGMTLVVAAVAALWILSLPVVGEKLAHWSERYPALDLSQPVDAQAIVILGGGSTRIAPEYGGPAATASTLDRLNYGAFLAHRTGLPVLVTGGPEEAAAMRATLTRDFQVPPRWVENRSGDTFDNARLSAPLLLSSGVHRIILVTSATHEWRAAQEFMSVGFEVVPAPVGSHGKRPYHALDYVPEPAGLMASHEALYELLGEPVRQLFIALHLRRHDPPPGS